MVNAQEWLKSQEEYNTKKKRAEVKELNISSKDLEGHLDLQDFIGLETLDCGDNKLASLDISKNKKLTSFRCSSNQTN